MSFFLSRFNIISLILKIFLFFLSVGLRQLVKGMLFLIILDLIISDLIVEELWLFELFSNFEIDVLFCILLKDV